MENIQEIEALVTARFAQEDEPMDRKFEFLSTCLEQAAECLDRRDVERAQAETAGLDPSEWPPSANEYFESLLELAEELGYPLFASLRHGDVRCIAFKNKVVSFSWFKPSDVDGSFDLLCIGRVA